MNFDKIFLGVVRCVTSNSWLDFGGDTTHVTLCLRTAVLTEVALSGWQDSSPCLVVIFF